MSEKVFVILEISLNNIDLNNTFGGFRHLVMYVERLRKLAPFSRKIIIANIRLEAILKRWLKETADEKTLLIEPCEVNIFQYLPHTRFCFKSSHRF